MTTSRFGSIGTPGQLHPEIPKLLQSKGPKIMDLDLAAGRALHTQSLYALRGGIPALYAIDRMEMDSVPVELYRPTPEPNLPVLVFFHGGGWVVGRAAEYHATCARLAVRAHCVVVSVDYRLAPEHKFPAAVEDARAVLRWLAEQGDAAGLDWQRLAVGGDSAGGNLAAVMALQSAQGLLPALCLQWLIYPALDFRDGDYPSRQTLGQGYGLEEDALHWFSAQYLRDETDKFSLLASPMMAEDSLLARVAPAHITSAGFDPLRDDAQRYAERLEAQGRLLHHSCYEEMWHGFIHQHGRFAESDWAIDEAVRALRIAFAHPAESRP